MKRQDTEIEIEIEDEITAVTQPMRRAPFGCSIPPPADSTAPFTVQIAREPGRADPTVMIRRDPPRTRWRERWSVAIMAAVTGLAVGISLTLIWSMTHFNTPRRAGAGAGPACPPATVQLR